MKIGIHSLSFIEVKGNIFISKESLIVGLLEISSQVKDPQEKLLLKDLAVMFAKINPYIE